MIDLICDFCESKKATIISGIFFIISIILNVYNLNFSYTIFISIIISGFPFLVSAVKTILKGKIKNSFLISIALIASILIKEYFAAAEIAILLQIGELLEHYTIKRAKKGISKLMSLSPKKVTLVEKDKDNLKLKEVLVSSVEVKNIIRVFQGNIIPLDGVIVSGSTFVNQSTLTGESFPVEKKIKDTVFSGTLNLSATVDIMVTKKEKDSSIQKLISIVEKAQNKKAPTQRVIDKLAVKLVPLALLVSILTFLITFILKFNIDDSINRAVTVLVVFCPCALFLSTPTAIMAAIGKATKHNIIIKSGEVLEKMGKVNMIAFDKTGTLTYGKLKVEDVVNLSDMSKDDFIKKIVSLEAKTNHPIGKSILEFAKENNILQMEVTEFNCILGKGIEGKILSKKYFLGSEKYLKEKNIEIESEIFKKYRNEAKIVILLSDEKKLLGFVTLCDTLRENAKEMIEELKKLSVHQILLTGDNKISAKYFSKKLGIEKVKSELLPEEKLKIIEDLKKNNTVCMVGDGVNDAPALKLSDVSIAMGKFGSDIVIDSSDITLISDDISKIPYLKKLSNKTLSTIKFNITISLIINIVSVFLSTIGFLNPLLGAIIHNLGSVLVILNATFLYDRKIN